jgi:hypothetical protein
VCGLSSDVPLSGFDEWSNIMPDGDVLFERAVDPMTSADMVEVGLAN